MESSGVSSNDFVSDNIRSNDISSDGDVGRCQSCDTFVAMPDVTTGGKVVFGKNSDRPRGEVQEVVAVPRTRHDEGNILEVRTFFIMKMFLGGCIAQR